MQIEFAYDLKGTPAKVNHATGVMTWDVFKYLSIPPQIRKIIEAHEEGHLVLDTKDELLADAYAFEKYKNTGDGVTLNDLFRALNDILSPNNPQSKQRILAQLQRINQFIQINPQIRNEMYASNYTGAENNGYESSFLGLGKAAKQRKMLLAEARAQRIRDKGEAAIIRAEKGASTAGGAFLSNLGSGLAGIAGNLFGGGSKQTTTNEDGTGGDEKSKEGMSATTIIIVVVVIILLGAAIYYFTKK